MFKKKNGKKSVKSGSSTIKFKNYFKQIAAPFKIYSERECNLKKFVLIIEIKRLNILKNIKIIFLAVLVISLNVNVLMIHLVKLFFAEEKI